MSAALPWPPDPDRSASLALAVAVGVALQLEELGLEPAIKWPNDLLVSDLKLCGFLPRLAWRAGRVRHARVGLGLNGTNSVPAGAVSLQQLRVRQRPAALGARVLRALEWAAAAAEQPELVRRQARHQQVIGPFDRRLQAQVLQLQRHTDRDGQGQRGSTVRVRRPGQGGTQPEASSGRGPNAALLAMAKALAVRHDHPCRGPDRLTLKPAVQTGPLASA